MAAVFLGRLSGMAGFEKLVAIKVVHPHLAEQAEFVEMFLDEARLSAKIHHPNAVEIFEVGEEDGLFFMAVELVQGKSLDDLQKGINRAGLRLEPRAFLTMVAKVCDALDAAHNLKTPGGSPLNLVHRDISPSNILISYDGFVKLIDFGIAYAQERIAKTQSGVVKGTYGYMAPEQLQGKRVDRRADIFSLGVVLYLLATGRHPFPGETQIARVSLVLQGCSEPPSAVLPGIDPALDLVIMKALSSDPADRQQTARELGQDLREILVRLGGMMESNDFAELMTTLFPEDIANDTRLIERAMGRRAETVDNSEKRAVSRRPKPRTRGATGHRLDDKNAGGSTQRIDYLKSKSTGRWKLFLVLAAAGIGAVTAFAYFHKGPPELTRVDRPAPTVDSESKSKPPFEENAAKSVELRIQGLPASADLLLDGKKITAVDGKIAVPVEKKALELIVVAKGYLPYKRIITPDESGDIVINLEKKRASPSRRVKTTSPPKGKSSTLMDCPFCEK